MLIWIRDNAVYNTRNAVRTKTHKTLNLSTQTFVTKHDILEQIERFIAADGSIETVFLEVEGTNIPVTHRSELEIVAKIATAYHNALIQNQCKCQLDLYSIPYINDERETNDSNFGNDEFSMENTNQLQHTNAETEIDSWDEEMHGEQLVFDASYELNADLVPWNGHDEETEERFGSYL